METEFATLELDDKNIIHVTGKEGADVTKSDFELIDNWIEKFNLEKQIIFADRSQSYSHTFDAQKMLMRKKNITAVAMYVTTPVKLELAEMAKDVYLRNFPVKVFTDKKEALTWLKSFL
ncbi:MAG: hypothetical protein DRQ01_00745 [Ignavibacteriae bacterium]|nr:MAG: hypothetical protein DRQ01_00745 [Ignavibacteriota bacterium]